MDEVADGTDVLDQACRAAEALAAIPPASFALSKRHMRQPAQDFLDAHGAEMDAEVRRVWTSREARGAVQRYVERTLDAGKGRVAEGEPHRPRPA